MRSLLALSLLAATATPALAQRGDDQGEAYEAMRSGRIRSLGDILSRIRPDMKRSFLGSDFAPEDDRYRLKFMQRGEVVVVDVDARTGEVMDDRRRGYDDQRERMMDDRRARAFEDRRQAIEDRDRYERARDRGYEDRRDRFEGRRERRR